MVKFAKNILNMCPDSTKEKIVQAAQQVFIA